MIKETLKKIVASQKTELLLGETGIAREKLDEIDLEVPHATIISGIRRCGKSTLLKQLMKKTGGCYYFNFEDARMAGFQIADFEKLDEALKEEYGENSYYFFDEIQNVSHWERFVRYLLDREKKVVITGSNASLLSKELGTKLTGRHLSYELFPFSYSEALLFSGKKPSKESFDEYLDTGGFPEYLKYRKAEMLQELFNDIISRDIIVRHKLRSEKTVKELAVYLLTNIGREFSYNALTKLFNLGATNSTIAFVSYFEDSYLLFTVPKFEYSLKKQLVNPKKIYAIDLGVCKYNSLAFSSEKGRLLENLVFIQLRRKNRLIFYFRQKGECDFLVKEKEKITQAYQVCYDLNEDNKEREIKGLLEAMSEFKLKRGLILTYNQDDEFLIEEKKIIVKPVWKWLLESS